MNMSRDVIFDLGGVVFRWQPLLLLQQLFAQHVPNEKTAKLWAEKIVQRTQLNAADIRHLIDNIPPHLIPIEGTVELIEKLKKTGHRLFFLSNMPRPYAEHLIKANPFFKHFDDGIFSAHVHEIKPTHSIFKMAQDRWALKADVIFIDDVQKNIDAAQSFGWQGIHFSDPHNLLHELTKLNYL
jgi:HAD superfamily hydrolase (TIGR01509 family)